jgi:YD repeat-containing protein
MITYCRTLISKPFARILLAFSVVISLLLLPNAPFMVHGRAWNMRQERSETARRTGQPKPGKPEGTFPDLIESRKGHQVERELPAAVPSTIRSRKNPEQPWNGKRFGEVGPNHEQSDNGAGTREPQRRRAHARKRLLTPPPVLDDTFINNFYTHTLPSYSPSSAELLYWRDQLRAGNAHGQGSLLLAAIEMGKTLFESAAYAGRGRTDSEYVGDLYWTYLMRDPNTELAGWSFWTSQVASNGRENVRRAFEESGDFATLVNGFTFGGSPSGSQYSLITSRVDPRTQPGNGLLTRDANWSVPLISLPGRAGLDLGLSLAYSSQVWTRSGPFIYFDEDNGFPSPGFRFGFPVVQRKVYDAQTNTNCYLLITPTGERVELRQVATTNVYEAADSSYLQLTDNGSSWLVRSTDGTQLTYQEHNNELHCVQIKDRNGNYLSVSYDGWGHITTITDTLGRVITFNYDSNHNPLTITQTWNSWTHTWITFGWSTQTLQASFTSGVSVIGPANNTNIPVISQVALNSDGSTYLFGYSNSLQVTSITRKSFDNVQRSQLVYTYQTPATDAPRLTASSVSASNWTGINGVPPQVTTTYDEVGNTCMMTAPDGTYFKETYGTDWKNGLMTGSEIWSGGVKQKWTETSWTQDDPTKSYQTNPRVTETNIYDKDLNRKRTTIEYWSSFGLPHVVAEYAGDGTNVIRYTNYDYKTDSVYVDRRIIGLPFRVTTIDGSWNLKAKTEYAYDGNNSGDLFQDTPAAATQHDRTNYGPSFVEGRGNLSLVLRYDINDPNNTNNTALETKYRVNSTGSVLMVRDPLGHQKLIAYGDSFADAVNRNTFAYPTTLTDEDSHNSYVKYNFEFGAVTRTEAPAPAGQTQGLIQTLNYDTTSGQLERVTTSNNGAYQRFWYGPDSVASFTTINNVADEAYSNKVYDGLGRLIGAATNFPGSTGGYKAQMTIYDQMGRTSKVSNPGEIDGYWVPAGDDAVGWLYTQQTYDWKGRPLVTTNPDSTTKEASYSGCGCAGGEVVTLTDEGTLTGDPPNQVIRKRQQKVFSDVLGRTVKTEVRNWDGSGAYGTGDDSSVYSTVVNTYNVLDQITQKREYAGSNLSSTYQDTIQTYDGFGRLATRHLPEQQDDPNFSTDSDHTTFTYNADGTIATVKDARGALTTYGYAGTNRGLVKSVTHTLTGSPTVSTSFNYDDVGNRTSMTDAFGTVTYALNQLSQITSETRSISGVGNFSISYSYNLSGQVTSLTDPFGAQVGYEYDTISRTNHVTGSNFGGVTEYAKDIKYRAWGALKSLTYGNLKSVAISYDANRQPTSWEIPGVIKRGYQYYNDHRLSFTQDQLIIHSKFDRANQYDQSGRVTKALSGAEARSQSTTNDRPYNETMTYDEFDHLRSRDVMNWDHGTSSGNVPYINNRRQGWIYDSDGRVSSGDSHYYYDAAGEISSFGEEEQYMTDQWFDGDGQRLKTFQRSWDDENSQWMTVDDTYYITSSVLHGAVISEVLPTGAKSHTYVHGGGSVLAIQTPDSSGGTVAWQHYDPGQSSYVQTWNTSSSSSLGELDPFGADAGRFKPLSLSPPSSPGKLQPYYGVPSLNSGFNGCELDGVPFDCDTAVELMAHGSHPLSDFLVGSGGGYKIIWVANYVDIDMGPPDYAPADGSWGNVTVGYRDEGHFEYEWESSQNPSVVARPIGGLEKMQAQFEKALAYSDCLGALSKVLAQIGVEAKFAPSTTDPMELFNLLRNQKGGGAVLVDVPQERLKDFLPEKATFQAVAGGGGLSGFYYNDPSNWRTRQRWSVVFLKSSYINTSQLNLERQPYEYVVTLIHELTHNAPNDSSERGQTYSHDEMDNAGRALGSRSFDQYVREHCIPKEFW